MGKIRPRRAKHPGVAVLFVLMVLAMTLTVSYAMLRTQTTALVIQQNEQLQMWARQAAMSGLRTALQRMNSADWEGVHSSVQGVLSDRQSFLVTYTAGDSTLLPTDPAYQEYPYRVTVRSTGRAADPNSPERSIVYEIQSVVRLVPRNFSAKLTDWDTMESYTIYQTRNDDFRIDIPCQLQGRVRIQGSLRIAPNYPDYVLAWWQYLQDLNLMRSVGYADCRPFLGPVFFPVNRQEYLQQIALSSALGVSWTHLAGSDVSSDWTNPTLPASYQIYPGGPSYSIPRLPDLLVNITYQPDPVENPLGIYFSEGSIQLKNNVHVRGALFCAGTLRIEHPSVQIEPVEIPTLYLSGGTSDPPVRLPSVSCQNFYVSRTGGGEVRGLVAAFDRFQIDKGPETVSFTMTGRLIARKILLQPREPWETLPWQNLYQQYTAEKYSLPSVERYFPVWLGKKGRDPTPRVIIGPDPTTVRYHWPRWDQAIFQPHPEDGTPLHPDQPGLRWELVRWME